MIDEKKLGQKKEGEENNEVPEKELSKEIRNKLQKEWNKQDADHKKWLEAQNAEEKKE